MNVIYFTLGQSLLDGEIRRQVLRIPEVSAALQQAQPSHDVDLMSCLLLDEEYRKVSVETKSALTDLVQQGLFERFCRARIPYADIIRRSTYRGPAAAAKEFKWLLRTGDPLTIYVIGPGLDEVPMLVKDHRAEFIDVIDRDPELQWFWAELKKVAHA